MPVVSIFSATDPS